MKFEKFLKNAGIRGTVLDSTEFGKFLLCGNVMLRIPDGVNIVSAFANRMPDAYEDVMRDAMNGTSLDAELTGAELPSPDATPSSIQRIFSDKYGGKISIDNKTFGMIERSDKVQIVREDFQDENFNDVDALVISSGFGDDREITGVIFDVTFFDKLHNEED